jgi:hypothetical protein
VARVAETAIGREGSLPWRYEQLHDAGGQVTVSGDRGGPLRKRLRKPEEKNNHDHLLADRQSSEALVETCGLFAGFAFDHTFMSS